MISLPLITSLAIGVVAVVVRLKTRTWTHPALMFALFWFVMSVLPILGVPELTVSTSALLYIFALTVAFALPVLITDWSASVAIAQGRRHAKSPYGQSILLWVVIILPLLWIVIMGIDLSRQGFDLSRLIYNPLEIGCLYLGGRYSGTLVPTVFAQAATVLNYVAVALAGVALGSRKGVVLRLLLLALTFVPSILTVLVMADKGTIFLAAAFFYGGVIVARLTSGDTALINGTTIGTCVLAVIVLVPVIMLAMLNRGSGDCSDMQRTLEIMSALGGDKAGNFSDPMQGSVAMRTSGMQFALRSYAFGHIFAFSDWVEHYFHGAGLQTYVDPASATWGYWTFMAIGKLVYPAYQLPPGYYAEYILYEDVLQSNIYTMFRGLIYDFGVVGSWVFMLLIGAGASLIYRRILENRSAPISQALYILLTGSIYSSYIFSPFTWNSVYAAPIGVSIVLALLGLWDRRGRAN